LNEVKNTRLRLGNTVFEDEIELLDTYIAILSQHLALTETDIKNISMDDELLSSVQARSFEDDIESMFREITLVLESKEKGSILVPGFIASEEKNPDLISLLNEAALLEMTKLPGITVVKKERLEVVMEEHNIVLTELLDTKNAIDIGEKSMADYVLIGSVTEIANTIAIFCRLINVDSANVEVVPQVITLRNRTEGP
jgi:TolB-like protein